MGTVTYFVVQAFDEDDDGNLIPRLPEAPPSASAARKRAMAIEGEAAGVIAFSRDADPEAGDYGPPTIIYQAGRVPDDME